MKGEDFGLEITDVQSMWNMIENKLINVVDKLDPLTEFKDSITTSSSKTPRVIKRKMNLRILR